ncbi:MAG: hypothetical protein IMZ46_01730, partial [Acidobacteria bacterium]|nr:hypothetical protein [Acidobacteriota bacterium]
MKRYQLPVRGELVEPRTWIHIRAGQIRGREQSRGRSSLRWEGQVMTRHSWVWQMKLMAVVAAVVLLCAVPAQGAVSGATPVKGKLPLLITNAGQGPGAKMVRLLVQRTGLVTDFDYSAEPREADLQKRPFKTLMVVLGSTAKGLGASGITIDQELERLNAVIAEARRLKMQIVVVLL